MQPLPERATICLFRKALAETESLTLSLANNTAIDSIKDVAGFFEYGTCASVGAGAVATSSGCP